MFFLETSKKRMIEMTTPIDFSDMKMPKSWDVVVLNADTWNEPNPVGDILGEVPVVPLNSVRYRNEGQVKVSPGERWVYGKARLPAGETLDLPYRENTEPASVCFTEDVAIPLIATRTETWMSMVPAEMLSLRSGVRHARDRTIIGGLGMGWQLHQIAAKKTVKEIVVVEQCDELVDWYGREMCERYGAELIVGDIWEEMDRFSTDDRFVIDIWPGWWHAKDDPYLRKARDKGFNIWAWGSARG